ncbi:6-aminohexanoate hydrolase [Bacillus sp. JJ722]|uniref:6-aminohexanoate hydrolase n=1 Tax=Bacillus sp. JJ722 TaxID=3122973 RepID=UPI0030003491
MIDVLNKWMLESTQNFNITVGIITIISLGSLIVLFIICKKFGRPDERTNGIYFKIISCMFLTQLIMNSSFISLVDSNIEYFRQFFLLFNSFVYLIGAIYAYGLYRKEFKN